MKIDTQLPSSKLTKSMDAHFLSAHKENLTRIQPCELTFFVRLSTWLAGKCMGRSQKRVTECELRLYLYCTENMKLLLLLLLQLQPVKYFRERIHIVSNTVHVISNSVVQEMWGLSFNKAFTFRCSEHKCFYFWKKMTLKLRLLIIQEIFPKVRGLRHTTCCVCNKELIRCEETANR